MPILLVQRIKEILYGYFKTLKSFGLFVLLTTAAGLVSAAVVFPLWYIATNAREIYTVIVLSLLGLSLLLMAALRIRWALKQSDRGGWRQLLTALGKITVFLFFIASLYGILWLFTIRLYTIAGASLFAYLLLLGLYKFGRGKKSLRFSPPES